MGSLFVLEYFLYILYDVHNRGGMVKLQCHWYYTIRSSEDSSSKKVHINMWAAIAQITCHYKGILPQKGIITVMRHRQATKM